MDRKIIIANCPKILDSLTRTDLQNNVTYLKPVTTPPITGKRDIMHTEILPLWTLAATALREANRIVLCGYSFPVHDVEARVLLVENLRKNSDKCFTIINKDPGVVQTFKKLSGTLPVAYYPYIKNWLDFHSAR